VQDDRALRPPYHLLSFLRIKGHSTKGMSCTDKNTMVFVVLEGEITVILHTTQVSPTPHFILDFTRFSLHAITHQT
jgi:hypothetical protein